jgi:hypothetical protein
MLYTQTHINPHARPECARGWVQRPLHAGRESRGPLSVPFRGRVLSVVRSAETRPQLQALGSKFIAHSSASGTCVLQSRELSDARGRSGVLPTEIPRGQNVLQRVQFGIRYVYGELHALTNISRAKSPTPHIPDSSDPPRSGATMIASAPCSSELSPTLRR